MTEPKPRAVLFDADGVTIIPQAPFSVQYAAAHGLDAKVLGSFFDERFGEALIGKRDLKELLEERRALWQWDGSMEDLLKQWFAAENVRNEALVTLIQQARKNGIRCYLATNQEKYRTQFIKESMFPGVFDKVFSSADIGVKKPDPKYYRFIIDELRRSQVITEPGDLAYFDDQSSNVESAGKLGIRAYLYSDVSQVEKLLQL
ncbi:MAG: HAD family hydrolase [Patescibacteria group bacterium]|jgi:putative hydrolase of the HAD superfamily